LFTNRLFENAAGKCYCKRFA